MLTARPNDDAGFLREVATLIAGAANWNSLDAVRIVRIDHWFGERWLGFCGKLHGIAGVRNRRLSTALTVPPFHPHRVESEESFSRTGDGFIRVPGGRGGRLHDYRPSELNLHRTLRGRRLYAWYSGDTATTGNGSLMVYAVHRGRNAAWYVGLAPRDDWRVVRHVGIGRSLLRDIRSRATAGCTELTGRCTDRTGRRA